MQQHYRSPRGTIAKPLGACDLCRERKIRCARDLNSDRCSSCRSGDLPCTVTYKRKRPGPPSKYTRRSSGTTSALVTDPLRDGVQVSEGTTTPDQHIVGWGEDKRSQAGSGAVSRPAAILFPSDYPPLIPSQWQLPWSDEQSAGAGPFDGIFTRSLLTTVIDMYFDYVYCLVPFPHPPTFLKDYHGHREQEPLQDEWTAMVFAMAAFTISLVPHQILPGDKPSLRRLTVESCGIAREHLAKPFTQNTLQRYFIVYCVGWVCHNMGQIAASKEYHGMNVASALNNQLDRESSYPSPSGQSQSLGAECDVPSDCELSRRLWWLIYTGDRSAALSEGGRMLIGDDELIDTSGPLHITSERTEMDRPSNSNLMPSVLDGFRCITDIWRLAGRILVRRERDHRNPPSGSALRLREAELAVLLDDLEHVLDDCPPHLLIDSSVNPSPRDIFDFPDTLDLPEYDEGRLLIREEPKRAFVIQQANIHMTRCVLFMGIQYQEYLLQLRLPVHTGSLPRFREAKHKVLADLLHILRTLPLDLIAVNALPGVSKIRYVAASLLDELDSHDSQSQELSAAQDYLVQYINFLTQIENLYSLADAE